VSRPEVPAGEAGLGLSNRHISARDSEPDGVHAVCYRNGELLQVKEPRNVPVGPGGRRGFVKGFSASSRRRLLYRLASIDQEAAGLPLFVTLTYPGEDWEAYAREMKRHLDNFHRWLSYRHPGASVIWRLEAQRRGAPHFHLLIFGIEFLNCYYVADAWFRIVGSEQRSHLAAGVQVAPTRTWRAATGYVAKYIAKIDTKGVGPSEVWSRPGRFWGIWGAKNLPIHPEYWRLSPEAAVQLRRLLRRHARSKGYRMRNSRSVSSFLPQHEAERALYYCQGEPWKSDRDPNGSNLLPALPGPGQRGPAPVGAPRHARFSRATMRRSGAGARATVCYPGHTGTEDQPEDG